MTESIYKEYQNKYYNPNDNDKKPGDNDNWKSIQKGFHDISATQLETSAGLTLGKGTENETSVTAAELAAMKNAGDIPPAPFIIASSNNPKLTIPANNVVSFQVNGIIEQARAFYAEFHRKYGNDYGVIFCVEFSGSNDIVFNSLSLDVSMLTTGIASVLTSVSDNIPDLYIRVKNFTAASVSLNSSIFGYNVFAIPFCRNLAVE